MKEMKLCETHGKKDCYCENRDEKTKETDYDHLMKLGEKEYLRLKKENKRNSIIILHKGEKINYRDMLEAVIGQWIVSQMPYFENDDFDDSFGAWFEGDADYEIKIIKKREQKEA